MWVRPVAATTMGCNYIMEEFTMYVFLGSLRTIFSIVFLLTLFAVGVSAGEWGKISEKEWNLGAPADYPDANAVIIFDEGSMDVKIGAITTYRHLRMKILNKAGIDEIGEIGITYYDDDKIKDLKAQTITPDGEVHKVSQKGINTQSFGSYKRKVISFPSLTDGCIIEYICRVVNERYGNLDPWYFQDTKLYTLHSEFCLNLWPGFTYSTAALNIPPDKQNPRLEELMNPDNFAGGKIMAYTWSMENLPPIKDEPYMRSPRNYMACIYNQLEKYSSPQYSTSFVRDWTDLGSRFQEILEHDYIDPRQPGADKSQMIGHLVDSLTAGRDDNSSRAKALYNFVKSEFKNDYSDETNYWLNENLIQLLQKKTGSPSEKNVLLVQLLKGAGMPSWPVLIGTRHDRVFLPKIYQFHQFDLLIAAVEIDSVLVFLDATSKFCPFGVLPPQSRVPGGCLIDGKKSGIVTLITSDMKSARYDRTKMYVSDDGSVACTTQVKFQGFLASVFGKLYEGQPEKEFLQSCFFDRLKATYSIDSMVFEQPEDDLFTAEIAYTISDFARKLDNNSLVRPLQFMFSENPFKSEKRFVPIDFIYPFDYQNIVEIYPAGELSSYKLPEALSARLPEVNFSRDCMFSGTHLVLSSVLSVKYPMISEKSYAQVRELFSTMATATEDEVVLTY
jgi:hypothetical protein